MTNDKGNNFFIPLTLALSHLGEGVAPVTTRRLFLGNRLAARYFASAACGGAITPHAMRPPALPVGSVV